MGRTRASFAADSHSSLKRRSGMSRVDHRAGFGGRGSGARSDTRRCFTRPGVSRSSVHPTPPHHTHVTHATRSARRDVPHDASLNSASVSVPFGTAPTKKHEVPNQLLPPPPRRTRTGRRSAVIRGEPPAFTARPPIGRRPVIRRLPTPSWQPGHRRRRLSFARIAEAKGAAPGRTRRNWPALSLCPRCRGPWRARTTLTTWRRVELCGRSSQSVYGRSGGR